MFANGSVTQTNTFTQPWWQVDLGSAAAVGGTTDTVDLSTNRPATQSSTDVGTAARAVDGNTNGVFAAGSVSRTASSSQPWWQVDLLTNSRVGNVTVHNRTDASADKLNNAVVFLSTASMSGRTYAQLMADSTVTKLYLGATPGAVTSLPTNTVARYVKVQSPATSAGVISLAEVTVTGTQPN